MFGVGSKPLEQSEPTTMCNTMAVRSCTGNNQNDKHGCSDSSITRFSRKYSSGKVWKPIELYIDNHVRKQQRFPHLSKKNRIKSRTDSRKSKRKKKAGNIETYSLPKICGNSSLLKGIYVYNDWGTEVKGFTRPIDIKFESIKRDGYKIIANETDINSLIATDELSGKFIVGKCSRRQCETMGKIHKFWRNKRTLMKNVIKYKPNVGRGTSRSGMNDSYKCFGYRKNPLKSGEINLYSYKPRTKEDYAQSLENDINQLAGEMERVASYLATQLPEYEMFHEVKKELNLPSLNENGCATQFSVGRNYWSKSHVDDDYYYTVLSCLSAKEEDHCKVLYYFCFPEYKIAVPMLSGDVLLFNPLMLHSCSNPAFENSYIFSAYVSKKTVMTQGMKKLSVLQCLINTKKV